MEVKAIRNLFEEPIFIKTEEIPDDVSCVKTSDGRVFKAQKADGGVFVLADMKEGETVDLSFDSGDDTGVEIENNEESKVLTVKINGEVFTTYTYSNELPKPYMGKIYTKDGQSFTRCDLETKSHPHQRSVFFGVGDINGCDLWNEKGERIGAQKHINFKKISSGNVYGDIVEENIWYDDSGEKLIDEERSFRFYNQSNKCRYIDVEIKFTATYCDIEFGNTKEAGPLGIRMAEELNAKEGSGKIKNSYGAKGEKEAWGKSAVFCEYGNDKYKVAVFDNEKNERYPTTWHVRDYGLFAANNLFFKGGLKINKGESLVYKYRICFADADVNMTDKFIVYNVGVK